MGAPLIGIIPARYLALIADSAYDLAKRAGLDIARVTQFETVATNHARRWARLISHNPERFPALCVPERNLAALGPLPPGVEVNNGVDAFALLRSSVYHELCPALPMPPTACLRTRLPDGFRELIAPHTPLDRIAFTLDLRWVERWESLPPQFQIDLAERIAAGLHEVTEQHPMAALIRTGRALKRLGNYPLGHIDHPGTQPLIAKFYPFKPRILPTSDPQTDIAIWQVRRAATAIFLGITTERLFSHEPLTQGGMTLLSCNDFSEL